MNRSDSLQTAVIPITSVRLSHDLIIMPWLDRNGHYKGVRKHIFMNLEKLICKPATAVFLDSTLLSTVFFPQSLILTPICCFLFCFLPSFHIPRVSHIWDVWLFVLPKHPLGLACTPNPKDACNMLYKSAKTDRIFSPSLCLRSLFFFLWGPPKMSALNSN